jgi:hypothetical protein
LLSTPSFRIGCTNLLYCICDAQPIISDRTQRKILVWRVPIIARHLPLPERSFSVTRVIRTERRKPCSGFEPETPRNDVMWRGHRAKYSNRIFCSPPTYAATATAAENVETGGDRTRDVVPGELKGRYMVLRFRHPIPMAR